MSSFAAIPAELLERLPTILANHAAGTEHPDPFDIHIMAFDGDDDTQMFSVDVYTDANKITPTDRRQKPYTEACCTSYFFTAAGGFDGEPQSWTSRYR